MVLQKNVITNITILKLYCNNVFTCIIKYKESIKKSLRKIGRYQIIKYFFV